MGELDIAIATSIENYHAKVKHVQILESHLLSLTFYKKLHYLFLCLQWVGESCADVAKMTPGPDDDVTEGWEQRALEKRAQKMATQLAEQLFQERAEQLTQKAKDIVTSGPPPCECGPRIKTEGEC